LKPAQASDAAWSLYLVRRVDDALYAGVTTDVARRFAAHCADCGAKALRGRGPLALVATWQIGERAEAQQLERVVKRLTKAEKEALVARPSLLQDLLR